MKAVCCCVLQAEDGIRDLVRSRGLGDVYKRQSLPPVAMSLTAGRPSPLRVAVVGSGPAGFYAAEALSLIHI